MTFTTRRYARTASDAFKDCDYASAVTQYRRRDSSWQYVVGICVVCALIIVWWV